VLPLKTPELVVVVPQRGSVLLLLPVLLVAVPPPLQLALLLLPLPLPRTSHPSAWNWAGKALLSLMKTWILN
jgi:hypothetical protein